MITISIKWRKRDALSYLKRTRAHPLREIALQQLALYWPVVVKRTAVNVFALPPGADRLQVLPPLRLAEYAVLEDNTTLIFSTFPMFVPSLSWQKDRF